MYAIGEVGEARNTHAPTRAWTFLVYGSGNLYRIYSMGSFRAYIGPSRTYFREVQQLVTSASRLELIYCAQESPVLTNCSTQSNSDLDDGSNLTVKHFSKIGQRI